MTEWISIKEKGPPSESCDCWISHCFQFRNCTGTEDLAAKQNFCKVDLVDAWYDAQEKRWKKSPDCTEEIKGEVLAYIKKPGPYIEKGKEIAMHQICPQCNASAPLIHRTTRTLDGYKMITAIYQCNHCLHVEGLSQPFSRIFHSK